MSGVPWLRERGKTPPAVCPRRVQAFVMLPVARQLTEPAVLRRTITRRTRTQSSLPALCLPSPSCPFSFSFSHVCFLPNIILSHLCFFFCVCPVEHLLMFTSELRCCFCCIQALFLMDSGIQVVISCRPFVTVTVMWYRLYTRLFMLRLSTQ